VIFVTVGHQMPFDRLVKAVDEWAGLRKRSDVFAQIGEGVYLPRNIAYARGLPPDEFNLRIEQASAVVAHAGTGTIIAALERGKPLLALPRLARLNETRNDHQIPTARHFASAGHIMSAFDEHELCLLLDRVESFRPAALLSARASDQLINTVRDFVFEDQSSRRASEQPLARLKSHTLPPAVR
jgi:UDP-N-acetylglucosamine transferase subunit ALG13